MRPDDVRYALVDFLRPSASIVAPEPDGSIHPSCRTTSHTTAGINFDKLPCINGTLQLPDSYLSLFYKVAKGGYAARLRPLTSRRPEPLLTFLSCYRHINFANATPDEVEQLTLACETAYHCI